MILPFVGLCSRNALTAGPFPVLSISSFENGTQVLTIIWIQSLQFLPYWRRRYTQFVRLSGEHAVAIANKLFKRSRF